ncbi:MAG: hypothetical protein II998_11780 [Clostridia bacterium]|nr:hypothetical protein [Clostridia bacterium]
MLKKFLIIILILLLGGVGYLVITDESITSIITGSKNNDMPSSESGFIEGWNGVNYGYSGYLISDKELSPCEKHIVESWAQLSDSIDISSYKISVDGFADMYYGLLYENPEYYYVESSFEYGFTDEYVEKIVPSYSVTDKETIKKETGAIYKSASLILNEVTDEMSDFQKVMTVHDYMVLNYRYDSTMANHNLTIMTTKTGVCDSYSKAFKFVMDLVGIECKIIESDEMQHSWNLVKVDGEWYHIDLTMDDPTEDKYAQVSHEFALLSTDAINNSQMPHYGYDLGDLKADSTKYDTAPWRNSTGSIVSISQVTYWISGNSVESSDGKIIYSDLDGGDGFWNMTASAGYTNSCMAGLGVYNGKLYFNSDTKIKSYNPEMDTVEDFSDVSGLCGLFINDGVMYYGNSPSSGKFQYAGEISLK